MAELIRRGARSQGLQPGNHPQRRRRLVLGLRYLGLGALTLLFVAPLVWMAVTSFKTDFESTRVPPTFWPNPFTLDPYRAVFQSPEFPVVRWLLNSLIAATAQTVLVVVTAATAGYPLARMDFPGKRIAFGAIVATLFIPPVVLMIPNYLIVDSFGWLNTLLVVIVPGAAGAFGVFFMRQFYLSLPREIEEAALIDGAGLFTVFRRVVIPLSRTALATLGVLSFLTNWNDFLWPVYVLFTSDSFTLQPGLNALQGAATVHFPIIMAGGVLTALPVLLLFIMAQRFVVEGISRTGLGGQ